MESLDRMRRKLKAGVTAASLFTLALGAGTYAYFTDTDFQDNTFAVGSVTIELMEQERQDDGLTSFTQNQVLMPLVGTSTGVEEVEGVGMMPVAENYVDKIIRVKNTGKSDAYVRIFVAIPSALDNPDNPAQNILHFNYTKASMEAGQWSSEQLTAQNFPITNSEGSTILCNIYSRTFENTLEAEDVTSTPAYIGFYLDSGVDMDADGNYTFGNAAIDYDFSKGITIPVFAQAVQADGFDCATYASLSGPEAAFKAAGLPDNPWAE
jgi:predicted ribosomally synthesized peptide with SipW-like signal peptide